MPAWLQSSELLDLAERRWGPRDTWKCVYCGRSAPDGAVDHFVPRERGGTDLPWNLVPADHTCNRSKGAHDPWAWMQAVGVAPSAIAALTSITRSPGWVRAGSDYRFPRFNALLYLNALALPRLIPRSPLPRSLAEVFVLDPAAWAPVTALRRIAADYLADLDRPPLSAQQLNRDLAARGLVRTARKGVYGYRGFYVVPELAAAGRLSAGDKATSAARRAERVRRQWAASPGLRG